MNAGIKKRLKLSTSALTRAQFISRHCVSVQEAARSSAGDTGVLCSAAHLAATRSY